MDYRGTITTTSRTGASLTTSFTGTGLYLIGRAGPAYGRFRVTVDGRSTVVDAGLYAGKRATSVHVRVLLFSAGLVAGDHTVTITWTGTKRAAATDYNIGIDAVDVIGALR